MTTTPNIYPSVNWENEEYLYQGQFERTTELDKRILERTMTGNIPLRMNIESRPMETRHTAFPMVSSNYRHPIVPIKKYLEYDTTKTFASIQSNGPVEGYLNNIAIESSLRNQYFAMQHGAIQTTYVPSSTSDLYIVNVPNTTNREMQPFPLLFEKEVYQTSGNTHLSNIGKNVFNNATKQQLKQL